MKTASDLNIYTYLTPHPLDDDNHLEEDWIDWLPGYTKGETEEGLPSYYHEDNIALYESIEELTAKVFRNALERMWPLLEGIHFNEIQLSIDYLNYMNTTSTLAGYNHGVSNPAKGVYVFHINHNLLNRYVHFLDGHEGVIPDMGIWEHELVHLLDHWQSVGSSSFGLSTIPANNLQHYILKYREEGIANLFDLMDGKIKGIPSIEAAKEKFQSNVEIVKAKLQALERTDEQIRSEIYHGYDFYEIGPWLILDLLDELFFIMDEFEDAETIESKISSGILIPDQQKLEILDLALSTIDNQYFIDRIISEA
jgi:hypothetical protein